MLRSKLHKDNDWQGEALAIMVRIISSGTGNSLLEILSYLAPMYGNGSVLSLVNIKNREVIETLDTEHVAEVNKVALSIKELGYGGYSMRHEKTGVCFRRDFDCVRFIPLMYRDSASYMLLVEQKEKRKADFEESDRCIELLAIAVNIRISELSLKNAAFVDPFTQLPNREKMVRKISACLAKEDRKENTCVGLLSFFCGEVQSDTEYEKRAELMRSVVGIVKKQYNNEFFLVSDGVIGFVSVGDVYALNSAMYDILEKCMEIPELSTSGVVCVTGEDARRCLYLCENALTETEEGVIDIVRESADGGGAGGGLHHDSSDGGDDGEDEAAYVFESSFREVAD